MGNDFSVALQQLRIARGLSQKQLSEALNVNRSTIAKWETGDRMPNAVMIARLSDCLGADVSALLRPSTGQTERPRVMLLDDEKIILQGGIPVLRQALPGAEICGFGVPLEAVRFAREHRIALAFLDIEMGRVSGLEVCRQLLAIQPQMNVVFLTAYRDYAFDCWATGASGFLLKPLTEEKVLHILPQLRCPVYGLAERMK